jgi:hypothetical protein
MSPPFSDMIFSFNVLQPLPPTTTTTKPTPNPTSWRWLYGSLGFEFHLHCRKWTGLFLLCRFLFVSIHFFITFLTKYYICLISWKWTFLWN